MYLLICVIIRNFLLSFILRRRKYVMYLKLVTMFIKVNLVLAETYVEIEREKIWLIVDM